MGIEKLKKGLVRLDTAGNAVQIVRDVDKSVLIVDRLYVDFLSIVYAEGDRTSNIINNIYYHLLNTEQKGSAKTKLDSQSEQFIKELKLEEHIKDSANFLSHVKSISEQITTDSVLNYLKHLLFVKIQQLKYVYICLDGKVPYGKVKEQRHRRYIKPIIDKFTNDNIASFYTDTSIRSKDEEIRIKFDKTKYYFNIGRCISAVKQPNFHKKLVDMIKSNIDATLVLTEDIKISGDALDSGSISVFKNEGKILFEFVFSNKHHGEGEQIIVREVIRDVSKLSDEDKQKTVVAFYSPDGDVVFLSMFLYLKLGVQIHTIKEYKLLPTPLNPCVYIDQRKLSELMLDLFNKYFTKIHEILIGTKYKIEQSKYLNQSLMIDIVYLVSLFGNDFLPILASMNIVSCFRNLIYIYAYYHAQQIESKKTTLEQNFLHSKTLNTYNPIFSNISSFFTVMADFESALIMDAYLAECTNERMGYQLARQYFGSLFTFYHMYTYCKIANSMYSKLIEKDQPTSLTEIFNQISVSDYLHLNKRILFMDKTDPNLYSKVPQPNVKKALKELDTQILDVSLNFYRFENGVMISAISDGFLKYFKNIDSGCEEVFRSYSGEEKIVIGDNVGKVPNFFSDTPNNYVYSYARIVIDNIIKIIDDPEKRNDEHIHEKLLKRLKTIPDSYDPNFLSKNMTKGIHEWDMNVSDNGWYNDLTNVDRLLNSKSNLNYVKDLLKKIQAFTDSNWTGVQKTLTDIRFFNPINNIELTETDLTVHMINSRRNEYYQLLYGDPYDLGNSKNEQYPYRNQIVGVLNYLTKPASQYLPKPQYSPKPQYQAYVPPQRRSEYQSRESSNQHPKYVPPQRRSESSTQQSEPQYQKYVPPQLRPGYQQQRSSNQYSSESRYQKYGGFQRLEPGSTTLTLANVRNYNSGKVIYNNLYKDVQNLRYITPYLETYDKVSERYVRNFMHLNTSNTAVLNETLNDISKDYLRSLSWIFDYYVNFNDELTDKSTMSTWVYRYSRSPLLKHIKAYLSTNPDLSALGNQYEKTLVPKSNYLTNFERSLFIYPTDELDINSTETKNVIMHIKQINVLAEYVSECLNISPENETEYDLLEKYDDVQRSVKIEKLDKLIKNDVNSDFIRNLISKLLNVVRKQSETDLDETTKLRFLLITAKHIQNVPAIVAKINDTKNIQQKKIIDCRNVSYLSKCHLTGAFDITPSYTYLSKCHLTGAFDITPSYTILRFFLESIAHICTKTHGSTSIVDLTDLDVSDGEFKLIHVRDMVVHSLLSINDSTFKQIFSDIKLNAINNIRDRVSTLLNDARKSEQSDENLAELNKIIKLIYYDSLMLSLRKKESIKLVLDNSMRIIEAISGENKIDLSAYRQKLEAVAEDLTEALFNAVFTSEFTLSEIFEQIYRQ